MSHERLANFPNEFMGQEFPLNFIFYSWVYGLEDALTDGDIVGQTQPIKSVYEDRKTLDPQLLVYDDGDILSMSKRRYQKHYSHKLNTTERAAGD